MVRDPRRRDAIVRQMRADGAAWSEVAAVLGVAKETARKLGLTLGVPQERATTTGGRQDRCRGPLPPGHAETWGLLVAGTVLEGVAYGG